MVAVPSMKKLMNHQAHQHVFFVKKERKYLSRRQDRRPRFRWVTLRAIGSLISLRQIVTCGKCIGKCFIIDINVSMVGFAWKIQNDIDESYLCKACSLILREPYQLDCGHRQCLSCIEAVEGYINQILNGTKFFY